MASIAKRISGESSRTLRSTLCRAYVQNVPKRGMAASADVGQLDSSKQSLPSRTPAKSEVGAYFLLSRLPRILPQPSAFESAFYAYNAKVQRALSQPFPKDLYFKKGSAAETQFAKEEEQREVGMKLWGTEESLSAASVVDVQGDASNIQSRITKADEANDIRSLERSSDKTLFLVVRKGKAGASSWTVPRTNVLTEGEDSLRNAVLKSLEAMLGENMDIWMVTNLPVGVVGKAADGNVDGYVMRAHITAGNPQPTSKDVDFAWLTREELEKHIDPSLWTDVKDLLSA